MIERAAEEIEGQRRRAVETMRIRAEEQGLELSAVTEDELKRRSSAGLLSDVFLLGNAFNPGPFQPGASTKVTVTPWSQEPLGFTYYLFLTIYFGLPIFPDLVQGLSARHPRWPYFSYGPFTIKSFEHLHIDMPFKIPAVVHRGTYTGNVILWQGTFYFGGPNTYIDRNSFHVTVA